MSILGKLLIVLNFLAAGAFAYLTLENWKVRHNLTTKALSRDVALVGLPVEPPSGSANVGSDSVPFHMESNGTLIENISKKDLVQILPKGDDVFGNTEGETVADQTAEVKRLQKKLLGPGPALIQPLDDKNPKTRFDALQAFLLNLARSGAERDGVNALFDLRVEGRGDSARRDLPLLGRTPSQSAALRALLAVSDLKDPQAITPQAAQASRILSAREAQKQFLLGEVKQAFAGADREQAEQRLTNAVINAFEAKDGRGGLGDAATGAAGWDQLAIVAAEPLTDKASCDKAIAAILAYANGKAGVTSETAALNGIATLINPPPINFNRDATIDTVATNLLNFKFDEAALPAIGTGANNSTGEKARRIAHVLYHLDAHRHAAAARDEATVAARKAWHERVATVVGLPEYVRAAEAQASEYADAASRLVAAITEEQSAFEANYQAQVQRVHFLFTQWLTQDAASKVQESITKENEKLKQERETERNKLRDELKKSIDDAKDSLAKLTNTQKQLFEIQKQLRDAQAALFTLEQELRRLELGDKAARR
jgi:hypothetical protein